MKHYVFILVKAINVLDIQKKKQRCNNRCKNGKYCHLHGKTVPKHSRLIYYNSSIYRFLTHDVPAYE